ncbi:MAG: tetratricopeptide repeat protein [Patescibacteria group bacterium]
MYESDSSTASAPEALGRAETPEEKAIKARESLMHDLDFTQAEKLITLITEGAEYKMGDWIALNKKFAQEFAKEGVGENAAERLLKHYQKQVFTELHLEGDPMAGIDGKLGSYTLYAFALYFNLKRPKVRVPYGNPRLEKLVNKDTDEAFEAYKKFPFAKNVKKSDFAEIYASIKSSTSSFRTEPEALGDWALALWESGYAGRKERKIGFPTILGIDSAKYPYAYGNMELVILPEGQSPIFVDKNGKLFSYDEGTKELKPRVAPVVFGNPFEEEGQEQTSPAEPTKVPVPAPVPSAPETLPTDPASVAKAAYIAGEKKMNNQQYESAMAKFKKADGLYPGSRPKYQIAFCLDKMARYDEALAAYKVFIDSNPDAEKYKTEIAEANKRITEITEQLGPPAVAVAESGGTAPPPSGGRI